MQVESSFKAPLVVAIIPARGGSKGIPRKNIVPLNGQPLLAYSIGHALGAETVSRTIVSTEDPQIAEVARQFGAEVPFSRPVELAGDRVLDLPVFQHAVQWLEQHEGVRPEVVVHLRPTSPIRPPGLIDQAVRQLIECPDATSVRSVSQPSQHPYRMFMTGPDGFLAPLLDVQGQTPHLLRRQDLPSIAWYNCVVDVTRRSTILECQSMTGPRISPLWIPSRLAVDIDEPVDLELAALRLRQLSSSNGGDDHEQ
jgi:CMP-N-acetylneuraminic acid synthetase